MLTVLKATDGIGMIKKEDCSKQAFTDREKKLVNGAYIT